MTEQMRRALHAVDVIASVCRRLETAGDLRGLDHIAGMSLDELDRLVLLELGIAA